MVAREAGHRERANRRHRLVAREAGAPGSARRGPRRCQNRDVHGVASVLPLASALPTLLFVGMVMAAVVGVMALISRKDIYDEIGGGGLSMEHEEDAASERPSGDEVAREVDFHDESDDPAIARAERELEIRQLLEARSARVVRQGGEPLDVERELARLLALGEVAVDAEDRAGRGAGGRGR